MMCLPAWGGRDGRHPVTVVWDDVVNDLDGRVFHHLLPVGVVSPIVQAGRGIPGPIFISAANGNQFGVGRRRCKAIRDLEVGVGVYLAHEAIAEHADADPPLVDCRRVERLEALRCHASLLS